MESRYEVLIVGGGPAGLSAAMTLGRLSRSALVCDDGRPRNAPSTHINNFPSRDGIHPAEWRKAARADLLKYKTIHFSESRVESLRKTEDGFVAVLSSKEEIHVRKVILASGVVDTLPAIPGFQELWGKGVFHCPFCHGFEVRGSKLGLFGSHPMLFHMVPMIRELASHLTVFTNGKKVLTSEQVEVLKNAGIDLVEDEVKELRRNGEKIAGVTLTNNESIDVDGLFFMPSEPFRMKSPLGETLGCERTEFGFYKVNERNGTTVAGVYACGDNMSMGHSVLLAAASGVTAGAAVIHELLTEKLGAPH